MDLNKLVKISKDTINEILIIFDFICVPLSYTNHLKDNTEIFFFQYYI